MDQQVIQYIAFNSSVNPSFWHRLTQLKLDVDKLGEGDRRIWGALSLCGNSSLEKAFIEVDSTSFNEEYEAQNLYLPLCGKIMNKNTIEQFKECNKNDLMHHESSIFQNEILKTKDVLKNPALLNYFYILSYADLKKYHYYYWFAFPATLGMNLSIIECKDIPSVFTDMQISNMLQSYLELPNEQKAFFIIKSNGTICTLSENSETENMDSYFAFTDISTNRGVYSWSLKNYLCLLAQNTHFKNLIGKDIRICSLRLSRQEKKLSINTSEIFKVQLPETCGDSGWIGWERNERGNMGPRMANMKSSMDPKSLCETSVDLNLKLMKWRLLPDIDLEKIKSLKCLLLGSGTLGCSVARVLLGWGVRYIDFVDNSTVSYSNPVRQSLFTFEDSLNGREKAAAASENLKKIFPGVISNGYNLSIPMPGHPVGESLIEQTKSAFKKLDELIASADVVFLLMDSRESRWLPTLLSQHHGKLVINAALGFETYLVMRHGLRNGKQQSEDYEYKTVDGFEMIKGDELGCYFCNDVTAPGNSLKDRTLDQQCTVTRPGISHIAGALAVELAISLSQHKLGPIAPAYYKKHKNTAETAFDDFASDSLLGMLPHSIRGFLSTFSQVLPATQHYKQCIACSDSVLNKYKEDGFSFLLDVFQSSKVLEDLTGLTEIYKVDQNEVWDLSDSEDEEV